ncbi:MAG: hypothetical protein IKO72_02260 [Kiritimatiellae bacterium]|nr:hypothetical protein [Kiritimatiellia bacterium]
MMIISKRMFPKSTLVALAAMVSLAATGSERISLDGLWDFRFEKGRSLEEVGKGGFKTNDKMTVPGCWNAMSRYFNQHGTGLYRRTFELDENAADAFLVVDGFGLRARFWLDGRDLGTSVLPWSCVEFRAGPLKAGRHTIEAAVDSIVDNSKVKLFWDFYDFYPYGGFHHGIALETVSDKNELRRVVVRTRDYRIGLVELEAEFAGAGAAADFEADVSFDGAAAKKVAFKGRRAKIEVPGFRLWTPEEPNLHNVSVTAPSSPGSRAKTVTTRFGVRQVGTEKGRITLNGRPVYLKGVNRHESHYEFGVSVPAAIMLEDIKNLKDMGGNFIRGSHYPQCAAFLDLCDELGVMVWEESLGWGNGPKQLNDPEFCDLQERQTRMMARRSINHPCIIITGFLNEPRSAQPACRKLVDRLVDAVHAEDTGHLVTFACNDTAHDASHYKTDVIAYNTYPCWYNDTMQNGSPEEMRENIRRCHRRIVKYFRDMHRDDRPIIVSETGVKADWGVHDPRGRAQYSEDFQAEYTRTMLEELFANLDIAGVAIWQFTDCKTYTRTGSHRARSYGVNTGGLYDLYRRPKLAVDAVRALYRAKPAYGPARDEAWEAKRTAALDKMRTFVYNTDGCDILYWPTNLPVSVKAFEDQRLRYALGTRIATVSYCPQSAGFGHFICNRAGEPLTNTVTSTFHGRDDARNAAADFFALGTDALEMAVDYCHRNGLGAFVSIRVNDQHDAASTIEKGYSALFPPFKKAHPEYLMGSIDRKKNGHLFCAGVSWSCVDFTHPEVRERMRMFVRQFLENYDVDGIEYDFNRHFILFKSVAEGGMASTEELEMMTGLMRDLRAISEEIGRRRGRPVVVCMRAPDSVGYDRACGIDLERWFAERLVDVWIGAGYFHLNPWEESVALAHRNGIRFYASIDESRIERVARSRKQPYIPGRETKAAYAARFAEAMAAGADGVYVFNLEGNALHDIAQIDGARSEGENKLYFARQRGMGGYRPDHWLKDGDRFDNLPQIDPGTPDKLKRRYASGETCAFTITVGDDFARAKTPPKITVKALATISAGDSLGLKVNGRPVKCSSSDKGLNVYELPAGLLVKGSNNFEVAFPDKGGDYTLDDFVVAIDYR